MGTPQSPRARTGVYTPKKLPSFVGAPRSTKDGGAHTKKKVGRTLFTLFTLDHFPWEHRGQQPRTRVHAPKIKEREKIFISDDDRPNHASSNWTFSIPIPSWQFSDHLSVPTHSQWSVTNHGPHPHSFPETHLEQSGVVHVLPPPQVGYPLQFARVQPCPHPTQVDE